MVYASTIENQKLTFGVSRRLYKSNVLIYDHQTESLWSQLRETAIAGPKVGKKLTKLSAKRTTWKRWLEIHPHTHVLSTDTGYHRDYSIDPYEGYYSEGGASGRCSGSSVTVASGRLCLLVRLAGLSSPNGSIFIA